MFESRKALLRTSKSSVLILKQTVIETKSHFLNNEHLKYMVLILSIFTLPISNVGLHYSQESLLVVRGWYVVVKGLSI